MADLPSLLGLIAAALIGGFLAGFLTVKANYVLIIFLGKMFSSGTASLRFLSVGVIASLGVLVATPFVAPGLGLSGPLAIPVLFFASFMLGVALAREETSPAEVGRIMAALFETSFPPTAESVGAAQISAARTAGLILETWPESSRAAISLLYAAFDSRTMVFLQSLRQGSLRWRRFVGLPPSERQAYLADWQADPRLVYAAHAFRILSSYAYYAKSEAWPQVGYDGQLLRDSYLE